MSIVTTIAHSLQSRLGPLAEEGARQVPVVQRRRKVAPATRAQALIVGLLAQPHACDEGLARAAAPCGVAVSTRAVEPRFPDPRAASLEALCGEAVCQGVPAERTPAPPVGRPPAVILQGSTAITRPAALRDRPPGCGGRSGGGQAAMGLPVPRDLRRGALTAVAVEAGRDGDQRTPWQSAPWPEGSVRIADLGDCDTQVSRDRRDPHGFGIARLACGTAIFTPEGPPIARLEDRSEPPKTVVDRPLLLTEPAKIPGRIAIGRVPPEVANRRRQQPIAAARDQGGRMPSRERWEWCDGTTFVTDVPGDRLAPAAIAVRDRARGQMGRRFRRWESLGRIADLTGSTVARQLVRLWSRPWAMLVPHGPLLGGAWGDRRGSLPKACATTRDRATPRATSRGDLEGPAVGIARIRQILRERARRGQRKQPGTFELLNDPSLLGYES